MASVYGRRGTDSKETASLTIRSINKKTPFTILITNDEQRGTSNAVSSEEAGQDGIGQIRKPAHVTSASCF